jgi:hypothetical protein
MRLKEIVAALALVCLVVPAALAETITGSGDNVLVGKPSASDQLADGRTYMTIGNRQVLLAEDAAHPFHRLPIDCDGACLMAGESGTCMGSCTGIDAGGDMAFFTWEGQNEGTWKLAGGSGKFAGGSGGGTWRNEGVLGAGFTHNSWQGTIEMP